MRVGSVLRSAEIKPSLLVICPETRTFFNLSFLSSFWLVSIQNHSLWNYITLSIYSSIVYFIIFSTLQMCSCCWCVSGTWVKLGSELTWLGLGWSLIGLGSVDLTWVGLQFDWFRLSWLDLGWVGLEFDWFRLSWLDLGWSLIGLG
jgi:hypothetical protein